VGKNTCGVGEKPVWRWEKHVLSWRKTFVEVGKNTCRGVKAI